MNKPLASLSQWALMLLISSFLFVEFFRLNDWLFSALEHTHGVNWIFLPAGFRILLVLVFGMPGALGIVLGNLWLDQSQLQAAHSIAVVLIAMASGLGPWFVKRWMESWGLLDRQLRDITAHRLLHFVLVYALVNAVSHQLIRWTFQPETAKPWLDVWPMFIGDAIGALVMLYVMKLSLPWFRQLAYKRV